MERFGSYFEVLGSPISVLTMFFSICLLDNTFYGQIWSALTQCGQSCRLGSNFFQTTRWTTTPILCRSDHYTHHEMNYLLYMLFIELFVCLLLNQRFQRRNPKMLNLVTFIWYCSCPKGEKNVIFCAFPCSFFDLAFFGICTYESGDK